MGRALARWVLAPLALFVLSGCAAVITEVVTRAYEDRTAEQQVTDVKIHTRILDFLASRDTKLPIDVNTDVWEGHVLFTGTVSDPALPGLIEKTARADGRVRDVYNHIRVVSSAVQASRRGQQAEDSSGGRNVGRIVNDAWVGAKIKVRLLAASDVKSVNYRWQSVLNRIYVIGTARSREERDLVMHILRTTKGVNSVRSYIRFK